jgi:hypothetical protein
MHGATIKLKSIYCVVGRSLHGLPVAQPHVLVEHMYLQHLSTMAYSNYCIIYC